MMSLPDDMSTKREKDVFNSRSYIYIYIKKEIIFIGYLI
jgi:hypothetical protein